MNKSFGKKRKSTDSVGVGTPAKAALQEGTPMKKAFNTSKRKSFDTPKGKKQTPAKQQNGNVTPATKLGKHMVHSILPLQFPFYSYS